MKAWIKGGLIASGISILLIILFFTTSLRFTFLGFIYYPALLIAFSVGLASCGEHAESCPEAWISFTIFFVASFFLVGAIIGLIVRKIKSRA